MRQSAQVVEHEGRLMAAVTRSEACGQCRACQFGQKETVYVDVGKLDVRAGDRVILEIDEGSLSRVSILAYGIPALLFLAGLFAGGAASEKDWVQALCALAGLALGLMMVKCAEKRFGKSGRFAPRVRMDRELGGEHGTDADEGGGS